MRSKIFYTKTTIEPSKGESMIGATIMIAILEWIKIAISVIPFKNHDEET